MIPAARGCSQAHQGSNLIQPAVVSSIKFQIKAWRVSRSRGGPDAFRDRLQICFTWRHNGHADCSSAAQILESTVHVCRARTHEADQSGAARGFPSAGPEWIPPGSAERRTLSTGSFPRRASTERVRNNKRECRRRCSVKARLASGLRKSAEIGHASSSLNTAARCC